MRTMRLAWIALVWVAMTGAARAQVELKNDSFQSGDPGYYQSGFVSGEIGASRFVAPEPDRQLLRIVLLFGDTQVQKQVAITVWDDSAGTDAPGAVLFSGLYQLTGAATAFQVLDLAANNLVVPQTFRVGIAFQHDGLPSIARDNDGTIAADRNFIYAKLVNSFQWRRASMLGVTGDWVIRAQISATTGPGPNDGGGVADAAPTGAPCASNSQCPGGQYCDLAGNACTFDCQSSADCNGNPCNSRGQCSGLDSGDGGCGCRTGHGAASLQLLLALWVALWIARRR